MDMGRIIRRITQKIGRGKVRVATQKRKLENHMQVVSAVPSTSCMRRERMASVMVLDLMLALG